MSDKTKTSQTAAEKLTDAAMQTGLLLMTAAATVGMIELPHEQNNKVAPIPATQPIFANPVPEANPDHNSTLRREREEPHPHYVSYNAAQRTAARAGRA